MSDYPLPNAAFDLSDQTALVTGATAGLGWRFARVLAAAGARVAIAGRRAERLNRLQALIANDGGIAFAVPMDMTDAGAIVGGVDSAEKALGPVTILVNNAGIPDAQRAVRMSVSLIDTVIATNLRGPFILACEVARRLIQREQRGRIVNLSSAAAFHYEGEGAALYSVTKAAIARMTEALAVEWSRFHINVNAIAPGSFHSEMMAGMIARIGDFAHKTPRRRICDPALLDSTLLYLCAPASEAVTGTVIRVDDGQFIR